MALFSGDMEIMISVAKRSIAPSQQISPPPTSSFSSSSAAAATATAAAAAAVHLRLIYAFSHKSQPIISEPMNHMAFVITCHRLQACGLLCACKAALQIHHPLTFAYTHLSYSAIPTGHNRLFVEPSPVYLTPASMPEIIVVFGR